MNLLYLYLAAWASGGLTLLLGWLVRLQGAFRWLELEVPLSLIAFGFAGLICMGSGIERWFGLACAGAAGVALLGLAHALRAGGAEPSAPAAPHESGSNQAP